ncbi:unnamed protein product [Rhizoctonia solani]|uniref:Uncharacterized protein n=1 Tax=Rhizoctonia solani TaxID=456999 RepID=A0A8H3BHG6_9AGAM|nr:unnamed protein product [Rhizoctonia solani]
MSNANSTKQGAAGSRLAQMVAHVKMLVQKDTYTSGFKNSVLTVISVLSVLALYWVIALVWMRNTIQSFKGRKVPKTAPKLSERNVEPMSKPVEDIGFNMDEVQEIPGEGELALKEAMPARDQIPEIEDEPQSGSSDEREPVHIISDDDTTVIGRGELVGVKGIPVVVPTIKHDFERPISPPATPPTEATDLNTPEADLGEALQAESSSDALAATNIANVVPNENFALCEPLARSDSEKTPRTIEEAAKAVEKHAKFVEDATSPTESSIESSRPEIDSPVSEFVVVSDVEEKSVENVRAPIESSDNAVGETEPKPPVFVEPTTTEVPATEALVPTQPSVEPQLPTTTAEEPKPDVPASVVDEPKLVEETKPTEEPKAIIEEAKVVEEPKATEISKVDEGILQEPVVEESKTTEQPEPVQAPKPEGSPKATFPSIAKLAREEPVTPAPPKSLRPRVMRRATGSTAAVAGVTTSPAPATVAVAPPVDDKATLRTQANIRADNALNRLAGSLLRSNTSERLPTSPTSPTSPILSGIPRPTSPVLRSSSPLMAPRSASPANVVRSESPSSDSGTNSRPTSPTFGMPRRGSIAVPRPPSRQSTLANVTNAPERSSPPAKKATFSNPPRGGAASPPPMPLPPSRQGSQGTVSPQQQGSVRGSQIPQVPQAAVMSPSVLSRKATIDSNGSPGSPPNGRRAASPPPTRALAEELTIDQATRRNTFFPSAVEGQPIASPTAVKPRPRPRTSTSGSAKAPMAPNTLLSTLTSKVNFPGGINPSSPSDSNPASPSPASPNRSDSFASAVSNRSSIYSFSDMSDMDMSTSDLDFAGRESHRMVLGRFDSMGSIASSDGGMSGNEEERHKKRAKRRAKARAQALKKQKRSKRN